jgi:hypothetical protein
MSRTFETIIPELRQELAELEAFRLEKRKSWGRGCYSAGGIFVLGGGIALACYLQGSVGPAIVSAVVTVFSLLGATFAVIIPAYSAFVTKFKTQFITAIAHHVGDGLSYDPSGCIPKSTYLQSEIFKKGVDRYSGEDLLSGRVGQTGFSAAEIHSEYKTTTTDSKGNRKTRWHTIFKGLFIQADFHKNFQGKTIVRPDTAEKAFGIIGRSLQKMGSTFDYPLVQLEDVEFEKEFVVNATDQVEARFILSTSMMQRLLELRKKFACPVAASFVDSSMFLAISTTTNLFEPKFGTSVLDESYLRQYYDQMALCASIVEDLGLNIRIWGKA